jgi:hypothetical protein
MDTESSYEVFQTAETLQEVGSTLRITERPRCSPDRHDDEVADDETLILEVIEAENDRLKAENRELRETMNKIDKLLKSTHPG